MSTKIRGKSLTLKFDDDDYKCDAHSVVLENEEMDGDVLTFCDVDSGGDRQWFFTINAVQSTDETSFWRFLWDNTGNTVAYIFAPHGNATASASQPHFTGNVTIGAKPSIGGEAKSTYSFDVRLDCTAEPTLDDGA